MFKRVLVGIDEETRGRDAIALARVLMDYDADVTFGHVHPALTRHAPESEAETDGATRELLTSVADESGIDAWTRSVGAASVGAGLHAIADEVAADLLVVGVTGRGRLTRALLGNPTTQAMTGAGCVVAVAPQGYADHSHELHRVGAAYDGSRASEAALSLAASLAESVTAELSAFDVVPVYQGLLTRRRHSFDRAVVSLKLARDRLAAHAGVEPHVAYGNPVEQLGGYSNTVDILVAGARGAGPVARLLRPSTTAALTDVVHCPLLVLTRGARERQADKAGARALSLAGHF